jgi:Fur family ferric uptake transcriptional regulator
LKVWETPFWLWVKREFFLTFFSFCFKMRITLIFEKENGVMKGYQTEQKRILLDFLKQNLTKGLSIEDIVSGLSGEHAPGKSTVYRLMNQLVEEGKVRRFVRGNSRHFVYQLMGSEHCQSHLHCRCVACGKLFHVDETLSRRVGQMLAPQGFSLDTAQTTLLSTCEGCGGR